MIITHTTTPIARYNFPIQRQCNGTREKKQQICFIKKGQNNMEKKTDAKT